jgi:hypothetical protein
LICCPYADRARSLAKQIQAILHFTIRDEMSDVQIIHQLLSQLGLKFRVSVVTVNRRLRRHEAESVPPGYRGMATAVECAGAAASAAAGA